MCTAGQRVSLTITGPGPSFFSFLFFSYSFYFLFLFFPFFFFPFQIFLPLLFFPISIVMAFFPAFEFFYICSFLFFFFFSFFVSSLTRPFLDKKSNFIFRFMHFKNIPVGESVLLKFFLDISRIILLECPIQSGGQHGYAHALALS